MVSLRHTVLLTPVPRAWPADALAVALDVVEATRPEADGRLVLPDGRPVPDVRLTGGRHLARGAVYEVEPGAGVARDGGPETVPDTGPKAHGAPASAVGDTVTPALEGHPAAAAGDTAREARPGDAGRTGRTGGTGSHPGRTAHAPREPAAGGSGEAAAPEHSGHPERVRVSVEEWNRRRALRLGVTTTGPEGEITADFALRAPDRPRVVEVAGRAHLAGVMPLLSRFEGRALLRFDDWWEAADTGRTSRSAPLRARLRCGAARADLRATPRPGPEGTWQVTVTARIRGRHLFRPVAALVLAFVHAHLRRAFADGLERMARDWNEEAPRLTAMPADALRREMLKDV
ncbi:hypothetical protein [Streptomyces sp. NPDC029526]|uniref:hypothetical protein n=1 Tax=Streptomyces sp. NPDC029526 TaxID=3155728 RepID=UPI0033EC284B